MPVMPSVPPPRGMFPPMMPGLPPLPPPPPSVMAQLMNNNHSGPPQARLPPRPAFVPHQLRHRVPQQSIPFPPPSARPAQMPPRLPSPPPQMQTPMPQQQQPVLSAQPMLYKNQINQEKPSQPSESSALSAGRPQAMPVVDNKSVPSKADKPPAAKVEQPPHPVSKAYAQATESTGKQRCLRCNLL